MNTESKLHLGIITALRNAQNATLSAEDFDARQISHFIDEIGINQTLTVKKAQLIDYNDLERLCQRTTAGKLTFDFSESN